MAQLTKTDIERIETIDKMVRQILRDHNAFIQAIEQLQRSSRVLEDYKHMLPRLAGPLDLAPSTGTSVWQHLVSRMMTILLARDIEPAELQGILAALLWGIWFLVVAPRTGTFGVYEILFDVAPPYFWGVTFIAQGCFQGFGLLTNRWRYRRLGAMLAVFFWLTISVLIMLVDWRTISAATSFGFALGAAWGYLRLRLDNAATPPERRTDE